MKVGKHRVWEGSVRAGWLFANSEVNGVVFTFDYRSPGILVYGDRNFARYKL